jgi:hypothetical protein
MSTSSRCKSIRAPERYQGSTEGGHVQDGWPLLITHNHNQQHTHHTHKAHPRVAQTMQARCYIARRAGGFSADSAGSWCYHVDPPSYTLRGAQHNTPPWRCHHQVSSLRIVPDYSQGNCVCSVHVLSCSLIWSPLPVLSLPFLCCTVNYSARISSALHCGSTWGC